jgi:hypothetical protein
MQKSTEVSLVLRAHQGTSCTIDIHLKSRWNLTHKDQTYSIAQSVASDGIEVVQVALSNAVLQQIHLRWHDMILASIRR